MILEWVEAVYNKETYLSDSANTASGQRRKSPCEIFFAKPIYIFRPHVALRKNRLLVDREIFEISDQKEEAKKQ